MSNSTSGPDRKSSDASSFQTAKNSFHNRMASLPTKLLSFGSEDGGKRSPEGSPLESGSRFFGSRSRAQPSTILTDSIDPTGPNPLVASPTGGAPHHTLDSPLQMSPVLSPSESSYSSTTSVKKRHSTSSHKITADHRQLSGTVNHCGRHANDWLFGGFSIRDTVKGVWGGDHHERDHNNNGHERHR